MREIERSAASVEEAIESGLAELGVSEQEASIEIVREPKSGFLGLASQPAVVRIRTRIDGPLEPAPARDEHGSSPEGPVEGTPGEDPSLEDQIDAAADFLEGLLDRMALVADVEVSESDGVTYVDIWGAEDEESIGLLIGRHGATLDGLQDLVRSAVQRRTGERCRVVVDVEDYRKRRHAQVVERAREAGRRAVKSGRQVALEPMSSLERKIVHDAIAEMDGVETASEGQEPSRRVVVRPLSERSEA